MSACFQVMFLPGLMGLPPSLLFLDVPKCDIACFLRLGCKPSRHRQPCPWSLQEEGAVQAWPGAPPWEYCCGQRMPFTSWEEQLFLIYQ